MRNIGRSSSGRRRLAAQQAEEEEEGPKKECGFISVSIGEGIGEIFRDLAWTV